MRAFVGPFDISSIPRSEPLVKLPSEMKLLKMNGFEPSAISIPVTLPVPDELTSTIQLLPAILPTELSSVERRIPRTVASKPGVNIPDVIELPSANELLVYGPKKMPLELKLRMTF